MDFDRIRDDEDTETLDDSEERPGCWQGVRKLALFLLVPVLLVVALVPAMMSSDGGRRWTLAKVNAAAAPAEVSFESWSLGWFSPPTMKEFSYKDKTRGVSVTAQHVTFDRGLLRLLPVGIWDLGEVALENVFVEASLAAQTESAPAKDASKAEKGGFFFLPIADVAAKLKMADGRVTVTDAADAPFTAENVEGSVTLTSWRKPIVVQTRMRVGGGLLVAQGHAQSIRDFVKGADGKGGPSEMKIELADVDLAAFRPLLRHATGQTWISSGSADGTMAVTVSSKERWKVKGGITVERLSVEMPGQPPSPKSDVTLNADIDCADGAVSVAMFDVASPWVNAEASGLLQAGAKGGAMTGAITAKATINLAPLAKDFGPALGLARDFRVKDGTVQLDVTMDGDNKAMLIHAKAAAAGLAMTVGGEPFTLKPEPSLEVKAVFPHDGAWPELEAFHLKAPFADVYASGRLDAAQVKARLDLTKFSRDTKRVMKSCPPMVGTVYLDVTSKRNKDAVAFASFLKLADVATEFQPGQITVIPQGTLKFDGRVPLKDDAPQREVLDAAFDLTLASGKATTGKLAGGWKRLMPGDGERPPQLRGFSATCDMDVNSMRRLLGGIIPAAAQRRLAALTGRVIANATAEAAGDTAKTRFNARTDMFDMEAEIDLTGPQTRRMMAAKGTTAIDFGMVTRMLNADGITEIALTGREPRTFRFSSPVSDGLPSVLAEGELTAATHVGSFKGLGLTAGPADATVTLRKGVLAMAYEPALNGGKLRFVPEAKVGGPDVPVLAFPAKTRLLENVTLTQGMMDSLMVAMNPLFQGSTVLGGSVTLDLQSCRIGQSRLPGYGIATEMDVVFKDLKLELGPSLQELLSMIKVKERIYTVAQLPMHITINEGRTHVDPVTMVIERQPVIFGGWVGFDGTVSYQVEIPVTERLVGAVTSKMLKGTSITIPVTGTVEEPRLDTNKLRNMLGEMLKGAVGDKTIEKAGDFLERLQRELTR